MDKKYIDFKTNKRKNAAINFEKKYFKLMNNSISVKTMENLRKIINVRLVKNAKDYVRYISKPTFVLQKIFSKNFAANLDAVNVVKFDANLLFTDTNSLVYEIKTEDFYKDKKLFDFSVY